VPQCYSGHQNCFVERLIASIRRECVDHIIVLGEAHLRQVLKSYARYYNETRTHLTLDKDAPVSRPVQRTGVVRSLGILADFITTTSEFGFSTRTLARGAPLSEHGSVEGVQEASDTAGCLNDAQAHQGDRPSLSAAVARHRCALGERATAAPRGWLGRTP